MNCDYFRQVAASTYVNHIIKIVPSLSPMSFIVKKRKIDWREKKILIRCHPTQPQKNCIADHDWIDFLLTYGWTDGKPHVSLTIYEIGGWCSIPYKIKYTEKLPYNIFNVDYKAWIILSMICRFRPQSTISHLLCRSPKFDKNILYLIGTFLGIPFRIVYKENR